MHKFLDDPTNTQTEAAVIFGGCRATIHREMKMRQQKLDKPKLDKIAASNK